jgi:hypothetical protein
MRSIRVLDKKVLGKKVTGWQVLPVDAPDFEQAALHACDLVLAGDPRIGKIPGARRTARGSRKATSSGPLQPSRKPTQSPAKKFGRSPRRKP